MRPHQRSSTLLCALSLLMLSSAPCLASDAISAEKPRQAVAEWLTQQLHRQVEASQVLVAPSVGTFEGCTIAHTRHEAIGATSLSLRCPGYILPQLAMVSFPVEIDGTSPALAHVMAHKAPPVVRVGATVSADWRTESLHAELPVVALDSGVVGDEIRVRIPQTNRIMHARILSAHTVTIVVAGA